MNRPNCVKYNQPMPKYVDRTGRPVPHGRMSQKNIDVLAKAMQVVKNYNA